MDQAEFTLKLWDLENWDCLLPSDLMYNDVRHAQSSPHLEQFQERLQRKRYIEKTLSICMCSSSLLQTTYLICVVPGQCGASGTWIPPPSHFESIISPEGTNLSALDYVTKDELLHYGYIIGSSQLGQLSNYEKAKELMAICLLLRFLARLQLVPCNSWGLSVNQWSTSRLRYLIRYDSRTQLPLRLVVKLSNPRPEILSYNPQCDFHMCIKNFPHLLLKVGTQSTEGDRIRMLLQASCIARIGNWLRASTSGKPIVIMAIYVDEHFEAHQYLLYQPDVRFPRVSTQLVDRIAIADAMLFKVEYVTKAFNLSKPHTAFELIFQLYNFLSAAKTDNDGFHEPMRRLVDANNLVAKKKYSAISKRKREDTEENSEETEENSSDRPRDSSVRRELTRAGYTLARPIPKEFTRLTPVSRNSRRCAG
jgi:hypothetical protein